MAIVSYGYDGTLSELPWSKMWELMGNVPVVRGSSDWAVTFRTGVDRTVRVAVGEGAGKGVYDVVDAVVDIVLPIVTGSPKWYTIVCHRDWSGTAGTTTFTYVLGGTTQAVAAGLQNVPGVVHDTPLALVRVSAGVQVPDGGAPGVQPIDLRVPLATAQAGPQIVASLKNKTGGQHIDANALGLVWESFGALGTELTIGSGWGYGSGVWTVPVSGLYDISAQVYYPAASDGTVGVRWVRDGAGDVVASDLHGNDGAAGALNAATTAYASAGQTFTVQAWSTATGGQNMGPSLSGNPARFTLKCVAANPALLSS